MKARALRPPQAALLTLLLAAAASTATVVTPTDLQGWQIVNTGTTSSLFTVGPATPPLGIGSYEFSVGANGDDASQLRHPGWGGTPLQDLTWLSYSTYVSHTGSGGQSPYLVLNISLNGSGVTDDMLFFEPVYQDTTYFPSNPQASLVDGQWQTWNALGGGWWSNMGYGGASPGTGVKSIADYLAAVGPTATIVNSGTGLGGIRFISGWGAPDWNNFVGSIDNVTIWAKSNANSYDFEPVPEPATCGILFAGLGGLAMMRRRRRV